MRPKRRRASSVLDDDQVRIDDVDGDTSSDSDVCETCGKTRKDHGDIEDHKFKEE